MMLIWALALFELLDFGKVCRNTGYAVCTLVLPIMLVGIADDCVTLRDAFRGKGKWPSVFEMPSKNQDAHARKAWVYME